MDGNDCFSELLWMPHSQHKISKFWENPNTFMNVRHHHVGIPYDRLCRRALENLGFYQIAKLKEINVDKYLISALVERWRPETNSFHLPVGEMTITLQDVSFLWGLPIRGKPIIGKADGPWVEVIERLLGIPEGEQQMKQKKRKKDDITAVTASQYALSLKNLRDRFHVMPKNAMQREIDWHARAHVLDILGSMVFTDTSGDGVPVMYLQFMEDLGRPTEYNWGAGVLSMLYRQLSIGAEKERSEISGPLLLLQLWCWSHLPLGRPKNIVKKNAGEEQEEDEELDYVPIFGAKWCATHEFPVPHNAGTEFYRNQIELIREGTINWQPYDDHVGDVDIQVHEDSAWWLARVPLIHFWIVEFHYPERVMRQFGRKQAVPPPFPKSEDILRKLRKIKHGGGKGRNWVTLHAKYVKEYDEFEERMLCEDDTFELACLPEYRRWFQEYGMYTVFCDSQCLGGLEDHIP